MVKRYGEDAATQAALRADELMAEGAVEGAASRRRIVTTIEQLQAEKPAEGETFQ
jgi:hypothetical protein